MSTTSGFRTCNGVPRYRGRLKRCKEAYCKSQGAEHYVDVFPSGEAAGKKVKELTDGQGARAMVITTTAAAAYQKAFDMLGPFRT